MYSRCMCVLVEFCVEPDGRRWERHKLCSGGNRQLRIHRCPHAWESSLAPAGTRGRLCGSPTGLDVPVKSIDLVSTFARVWNCGHTGHNVVFGKGALARPWMEK